MVQKRIVIPRITLRIHGCQAGLVLYAASVRGHYYGSDSAVNLTMGNYMMFEFTRATQPRFCGSDISGHPIREIQNTDRKRLPLSQQSHVLLPPRLPPPQRPPDPAQMRESPTITNHPQHSYSHANRND